MIQPLSGIRILDLTRLLPGPFITQLFCDLGAEVIKVETRTAGDYSRLAPPEMGLGDLFEAINRGKKSVAINYRNPRGREAFLKLAASADVVIGGTLPFQGGLACYNVYETADGKYLSLAALEPSFWSDFC